MSISMKRYNDTIITPKDDRILFDQIFDDYGLIYGGSATMAASNKIHVGAARGFIKGTEVIVEAEDIAVNLSDSGTKNGRLKIVMDLADTETPIKFESEVAASFPALEQDANINYDNGRYEVVFATYKATETTISSVALVMPTMQSVKAKIQGINQSLIDKSMNALFTVKTHGALTTSGYYTLTSITKNFGSNDIYVDQYGDIIFKKTGHYMLNISLVLDKNFTSTLADISVHRYDHTGGSDTLISEDYFYAANNVHTGNVNILIPITAYGYLKIYCFGKVQGGYISLYRVE